MSAGVTEVLILGDLTDAKDRHPSSLVNRLYDEVRALASEFRVIILCGNHDFLHVSEPFFRFIDGARAEFIFEVAETRLSIGAALLVPALSRWDFAVPAVDYLMTHATFSGAAAENGQLLSGVNSAVLDGFAGSVISGDVHVPQRMLGGRIEYVGAPYHVRFGDVFEPRVMLVGDDGNRSNLYFPAPRKRVLRISRLEDLDDEVASEGDYVRVQCAMRRADLVGWRDYREEIKRVAVERGWVYFGAEPLLTDDLVGGTPARTGAVVGESAESLVEEYARRHKVSRGYADVGLRLLLRED